MAEELPRADQTVDLVAGGSDQEEGAAAKERVSIATELVAEYACNIQRGMVTKVYMNWLTIWYAYESVFPQKLAFQHTRISSVLCSRTES